MSQDQAAKLIRENLVEAPGLVDGDLIQACKGLIGIDEVSKRVSVKPVGLTHKEWIVLYCLGMRLLSLLTGDPSHAEVKPQQLASELNLPRNQIAAYASTLTRKDPKPLRSGKRGSYEVWLPAMKEYLAQIRQKLGKQ